MTKPDLVLVHSFPTNSFILKGLISYLEDFFTVHFIDLPGFTTDISALEEVSVTGYTKFFEKKLDELNLDEYVIAGISFGFLIVNNAKLNLRKCKGIIAIEPYTGKKSIHRLNIFQQTIILMFLNIICFFSLHYKIWNSSYFRKLLGLTGQPEKRIHHTLNHVDGRTFFETARIIFTYNQHILFHNMPYVIAINEEDTQVNYEYLIKQFTDNTTKLFLLKIQTDHYPTSITKEYFKKMIPESDVQYIINFLFGDRR